MSDVKMLLTKETTGIEQVVNINMIHPSMNIYEDEFYEKVKLSLEEEGLLRPLIVVPMTVREWKRLQETNPDMLPPPALLDEDVVYQVRCGNNRYWAAKEMEVKLITITTAGSLREASKLCRAQQKEMAMWKEEDERWA